ncbi:MAG TPA: class F sortase [Ktedonobacteraceae bacterium]|nr:class F sortase [Ktedonobacteraceae bacterium]
MRPVKLVMGLLALTVAFAALGGCGQELASQPSLKVNPPSASSPVAHHTASSVEIPATKGDANPVRLVIPAIGVNALIEGVGVTSSGDLAVPQQHPWDDVGWYTAGPRPGEPGSSVIDGHLDRPGGSPAVFWYLRDMRVGDAVMVMNAYGKTLKFHVRAIQLYAPQDTPIQQIFGNDTGDYLNLITCAGDWIPSQHQTALRLVVYTSLD